MNLQQLQERIQKAVPASLHERLKNILSVSKPANLVSPVRIACDLGKAKLAVMEMKKNGDEFTLTRFCKVPRPKEEADLIQTIQKTFVENGFETNKVRISVKGQGVVVRFVLFPQMTDEELKGAITFEAEKYIPFKSDEVIIDYHIIEQNLDNNSGKKMNVLLVAVKREEIYPIINLYKSAGLIVEAVDIDSIAFMNALEFLYPDDFKASVGILDVGSEITTLGIVRDSKPQFIRDISYGGIDLVKRLKRKLGMTMEQALEQLEVDRKPEANVEKELIDGLSPLIADLRVSLDYYLDQVHLSDSLEKIFLAGGTGYLPIVSDTLSKELGIKITGIDLLEKIKLGAGISPDEMKKNSSLLPIAIGLCVRDL